MLAQVPEEQVVEPGFSLTIKKNSPDAGLFSYCVNMAEREGFEPPCRLPGKTLSRRPRYDHFGTSPDSDL